MDQKVTSNLDPGLDENFAAQSNKTELPADMNNTQGILDQTLGQIITDNPQAKESLMRAMHVTPEQFQVLLTMTQDDAMMNTKVSDLFKNGTIQKALEEKGMPVQGIPVTQSADGVEFAGDQTVVSAIQEQTSILKRVKRLFGF